MGIIEYETTIYQKSDMKCFFLRIYRGLQIHQLCQNGIDAKDLSFQNMFTRHHTTQKKQPRLAPSDAPVLPIWGIQQIGDICFLFLKNDLNSY